MYQPQGVIDLITETEIGVDDDDDDNVEQPQQKQQQSGLTLKGLAALRSKDLIKMANEKTSSRSTRGVKRKPSNHDTTNEDHQHHHHHHHHQQQQQQQQRQQNINKAAPVNNNDVFNTSFLIVPDSLWQPLEKTLIILCSVISLLKRSSLQQTWKNIQSFAPKLIDLDMIKALHIFAPACVFVSQHHRILAHSDKYYDEGDDGGDDTLIIDVQHAWALKDDPTTSLSMVGKKMAGKTDTDMNTPTPPTTTTNKHAKLIAAVKRSVLNFMMKLHNAKYKAYSLRQHKAWHADFLAKLSLQDIIDVAKVASYSFQHRQPQQRQQSNRTFHQTTTTSTTNRVTQAPQISKKHAPCRDRSPMSTTAFLSHLITLPWYTNQIAHIEELPARQATYTALTAQLASPIIMNTLTSVVNKLPHGMFTHQAAAIDSLLAGKHTVLATSTASGKSMAYIIPILNALIMDKSACALLMFPTKALAQDQLQNIETIVAAVFGGDDNDITEVPCVEIYDGDTEMSVRPAIIERAQILITNPDMLHTSILPYHNNFSRLFQNLQYVVIDEAHAMRGVFGCHCAMVFRRLRRITSLYNNSNTRLPTFMFTSATIACPVEHSAALLGVDVTQVTGIDEDGSPHGSKSYVLWNPPLLLSQHRSVADEDTHHLDVGGGVEMAGPSKNEASSSCHVSSPSSSPSQLQQKQQSKQVNPPTRQSARSRKLAEDALNAIEAVGMIVKGAPSSHPTFNNMGTDNANDDHSIILSRKGLMLLAKKKNDEERRSSPIVETAMLLAEAVQHGLQTLAFCKTRKLSELVASYAKEILSTTAPDLVPAIAVYRSGYSPTERRNVEHSLQNGTLRGVAATNALELGIDIGQLDVTLTLGFPSSIASLWQQAGRAGRRGKHSVALYVAFDGPLDQHFMNHPASLFRKPMERAIASTNNLSVMSDHLACAAAELPLNTHIDAALFGTAHFNKATQNLLTSQILSLDASHHNNNHAILHYSGPHNKPSSKIQLRAIDPGRYVIVDENTNTTLEEVEEGKAFFQVYDGAIYLHQGKTYICSKIDHSTKVAIVRPIKVSYYTQIIDHTRICVVGGQTAFPGGQQSHIATKAQCNPARVTTTFAGFHRIKRGTSQIIDTVKLRMPDVQYDTQATYIRLPPSLRATLQEAGLSFSEGVHAASHQILNALPLFVMCDPGDIGAECDTSIDDGKVKIERILIYDKYQGGIGVAAAAAMVMREVLTKAVEMLEECDCRLDGGCPSCLHHPGCGEYNAHLSKKAGRIVLQAALQARY
jgi:DEAD/DEAH box helicase domain-containing protein